jgi:3-hydroxymyristoyl/3-hydroxydecanoyl-(acyl carrier protein) dehydratase
MPLDHFSAFSFVDRITSIDRNGEIKGYFRIPKHLDHFPQSLVAEAIGQLAAWFAMSTLNFTSRPVAALAGEIKYYKESKPGQILSLIAKIESCDYDFVTYSGIAFSGGHLLLELKDCTGVMLPQAEFDDPKVVENQFYLLKTIGGRENRLAVAPYILGIDMHSDTVGTLEGSLIIPKQADFFVDHFPRKPVFPATLLIYALTSMVMENTNSITSRPSTVKVSISAIRKVKVRSWISPGEHVRLKAKALPAESTPNSLELTANLSGKLVASATLQLTDIESPPMA